RPPRRHARARPDRRGDSAFRFALEGHSAPPRGDAPVLERPGPERVPHRRRARPGRRAASSLAMTSRHRTDAAISWLMEGDPAIRWQTLRDLAGAPARRVEQERRRVAREGWGARLLARQGRDGTWAGERGDPDRGMYGPKWIWTTYTMLLLRDFGLSADNRQARNACRLLLDRGLRDDGGVDYGRWAKWTRRGETCVTGMVLSLLAYFDYDDPRV